MYSVYLDGILINDPVIGIEDFTLTLERTFDSDNIFREFSESTLTFTGDGYNYLCSRLKADYCAKVDLQVDIYGQTIFEGQIIVSFATVNLTKRTFETQIVDTSYRGLIRERVKNEISLASTLTVDCEAISPILESTIQLRDINNSVVRDCLVFNVHDVFRFLIDSMSNNTVAFQSTYLTNIPVSITTGWNLSDMAGINNERKYPKISFEKLYSDIRKLLQIYASIEIIGGVPTIVMEQENYFFNNAASGFQLSQFPYDTNISVDEERIYSIVEIGSSEVDVESTNNAFINNKIDGWQETTLGSCGCVFDKDNVENLKPELIIDSGNILDVIASQDGQDELYFIQLDPASNNTLMVDNGGKWYYNSSFRNELVALRWSLQFNNCIYLTRATSSAFRAVSNNDIGDPPGCGIQFINVGNANPFYLCQGYMRYPDLITDNLNGLQVFNFNTPCINMIGCTNSFTAYQIQVTGDYSFIATREVTMNYSIINTQNIQFDFAINIEIYTDNTFTTLVYFQTETQSQTVTGTGAVFKQLTITTPLINIPSGYFVRVRCDMQAQANINTNVFGGYGRGEFKTNDELMACNVIQDEGNRIPYLMKFDHPICKYDYDLINANRRNYIEVAGYKGWVKRLDYNPKGIGTFELLTEEIPCCDA